MLLDKLPEGVANDICDPVTLRETLSKETAEDDAFSLADTDKLGDCDCDVDGDGKPNNDPELDGVTGAIVNTADVEPLTHGDTLMEPDELTLGDTDPLPLPVDRVATPDIGSGVNDKLKLGDGLNELDAQPLDDTEPLPLDELENDTADVVGSNDKLGLTLGE